jgi:hypothetical protein
MRWAPAIVVPEDGSARANEVQGDFRVMLYELVGVVSVDENDVCSTVKWAKVERSRVSQQLGDLRSEG